MAYDDGESDTGVRCAQRETGTEERATIFTSHAARHLGLSQFPLLRARGRGKDGVNAMVPVRNDLTIRAFCFYSFPKIDNITFLDYFKPKS